MLAIKRSDERGHKDYGWLDTYHSFSFGHWAPPRGVENGWGFRSLRVINEDFVAPGRGFDQHPHNDMEIISYVLSGRLAHRDTLGSVRSIGHGEVQRMSAGTGLEHSEFNNSETDPVHLLQIWIKPREKGLTPRYEDRVFDAAGRRNALQIIASPDGRSGSLSIYQDVLVFASETDAGTSITHELGAGRHAWVQVAKGELRVNGEVLGAGDGVAISDEAAVRIEATKDSEFLFFDLA